MELVFNEISGYSKESNRYGAKARMTSFLDLCKKAKMEGFNLQAWIDSLKEIVLIETDTLPSQKKVNLRDDHGKDALTAFAQKLLQSPYVKGVINSLPFNPKEGNFIRSAYSDGRIELVLIWTDEGFGMVVQSTGRNLRETEAMAQILKDQYS